MWQTIVHKRGSPLCSCWHMEKVDAKIFPRKWMYNREECLQNWVWGKFKHKKEKKRCGVLMLRIIKVGMVKILSMETSLSTVYTLCDCDSEKPRKPEDLWHDQEDLQSLLHQSLFNTDFTTNICKWLIHHFFFFILFL